MSMRGATPTRALSRWKGERAEIPNRTPSCIELQRIWELRTFCVSAREMKPCVGTRRTKKVKDRLSCPAFNCYTRSNRMPQKHPTTERTGGPGASHGSERRYTFEFRIRDWYVPRVYKNSCRMQTLRFASPTIRMPRRRGSAPPISFTSADMAGPAVTKDTTSQRPSPNGRSRSFLGIGGVTTSMSILTTIKKAQHRSMPRG